jgi:hypothetical protein
MAVLSGTPLFFGLAEGRRAVWTPKRIVIVVVGLLIFLTGYSVYAIYLGGIDGLPPLPEEYWSRYDGVVDPNGVKIRVNPVVIKLQQSFGSECEELKRPIKLEVPARGLVLSATEFHIEDDGRVRLAPLSVAMFSKPRPGEKAPEITTLQCEIAFLTFERPIMSIADMGKHKITNAEVAGNIRLVNNRRTPQRDDDLFVDIRNGPLYYQDSTHRLWTNDVVRVKDTQSKPKPMEINGTGMDVDLLAETRTQPGRPAAPKGKQDSITGVKHMLLRSGVDMHLYVDSRTGFLAAQPEKPVAKPAKEGDNPAEEKSHLIIKTQGPFAYDMITDVARFDIPTPHPDTDSKFPEHVEVTRCHDSLGKLDQLICEHLEIHFRRKGKDPASGKPGSVAAEEKLATPAEKTAPGDDREVQLEIQTVHAIGKEVTLTSDAEMLEAHGTDLFYDAIQMRTILKSTGEMWAIKEGNEIHSRELHIQQYKDRSYTAAALGAGRIDMLDKKTGKRPQHARWRDKLTLTRDGGYDLLHLQGDASFNDDATGQQLEAETLKVWLEPNDPAKAKEAKEQPKEETPASSSRRPHHLEAVGKVRAQSPELTIRDTSRLVVWFRDVTPPEKVGPPAPDKPAPSTPPDPMTQPEGPTSGSSQPGTAPAPAKKARPIHLSARSVEAYVQRSPDKNELEKLWTEGAVCVQQEPEKPGEKGVDITGDTLQMTHFAEGNYLVVTGDLARLETDKMCIMGPEVNIDQTKNTAWVNGIGAMTMESNSGFQGEKLNRTVPLTIHWNKSMYFNGKFAEFHGNIQADQENARMTCQSLQAFFDRPISLKESDKGQPPAKVQNLVCDKQVRVEDGVIEQGRYVKYQRIEGPTVAYDNAEGIVQASGPGHVRLLQIGDADDQRPGAKPATPARPNSTTKETKNSELKLTYVQFYKRMYGNNKTHTITFYENVRVLHFPCDNPRLEIDFERFLERLPIGAIYLRCDNLKVYSRAEGAERGVQEMEARGRVTVEAQEFSGRAELVTYNQEKDQIIFDGAGAGTATLYKMEPNGQQRTINARKIIYSRKTGKADILDGNSIRGQ